MAARVADHSPVRSRPRNLPEYKKASKPAGFEALFRYFVIVQPRSSIIRAS